MRIPLERFMVVSPLCVWPMQAAGGGGRANGCDGSGCSGLSHFFPFSYFNAFPAYSTGCIEDILAHIQIAISGRILLPSRSQNRLFWLCP